MNDPSEPGLAPTLLVVDDEAVQRLIASRMAEKMGYSTAAVGTLEEAAAVLVEREVGIVILDLSLGDRDGIELLRDIARLKRDPLIIFISGFDERVRETAARLAVALGLRVAGTLAKPLQANGLLAAISAAPRMRSRARTETPVSVTPAMLDAALEAGEIHCVYQPKVTLKDRRIIGFECLARWHNVELGSIGPDMFVPVAERHGLIDKMTLDILDSALGQLRVWHAIDPALKMAVNLSPYSLCDLNLPERIGECLERHGVDPECLSLEVTEGAVMADFIAAADILTRLRIHGIGISVDDFGTGHSSLLSLLRLPFDELKIDQSFVRGLLNDPDAMKIVRAVLSLAASMELRVVAEGIETEAVARRLTELGADIGQGYLFAPPLPVAAMTTLLQGQTSIA